MAKADMEIKVDMIQGEVLHNLMEDVKAFREYVIRRLDLLDEYLPEAARREAWSIRQDFEIAEFRAGRGA